MEKAKLIIVTLLIFAIVFSIISIAITYSGTQYKPVNNNPVRQVSAGSNGAGGNVGLIVNPPAGGNSG